MKKISLLLLLLVGLANVVYAQLPVTQLPVTDGLVAHWDFENNDENQAPGANAALNGMPMSMSMNGPTFSQDTPPGSSGSRSRRFDGMDQYINVDNPVLADFDSDYTVSAWFRSDEAPSGGQRFMVFESQGFVISLGLREGCPTANTNVQFFINTTGDNRNIDVQVPDGDIDDEWNHAAVVYKNDGSTRTLSAYFNGVLQETITLADPPDLDPNPSFFNIGTYRDADARFFNGFIDDVAIWDRALTPAEIFLLSDAEQTMVTTAIDEDDGDLESESGMANSTSLREAINHSASGSLITFAPSLNGETITLTLPDGQLLIDKDLVIDASDLSNGLTIDANQLSRVMKIEPNNTVALQGLTLTGGNATGTFFPNNSGGAIYADGSGSSTPSNSPSTLAPSPEILLTLEAAASSATAEIVAARA